MAGLMQCPSCGAEVAQGDLICFECGANLARLMHTTDAPGSPADRAEPETHTQDEPAQRSTTEAHTASAVSEQPEAPHTEAQPHECPHCGATITQPDTVVCLECLRPIERGGSSTTVSADHDDAEAPTHGSLTLTLLDDPSSSVTVAAGERMLLGRDPALSPAASILARFDNISRRHASISVESDGSVSVTDEYSTNGTFIGEHAVPAGGRMSAFDGDTLRLAAHCQLRISLHT